MRAFTVTLDDVVACPAHSLLPAHYNADGSCKCEVDARLAKLALAVHSGANNQVLIRRAMRLAELLQADYPAHAQRLRVALSRRGESLGTRYERIEAIRKELALAQRTEGDDRSD